MRAAWLFGGVLQVAETRCERTVVVILTIHFRLFSTARCIVAFATTIVQRPLWFPGTFGESFLFQLQNVESSSNPMATE